MYNFSIQHFSVIVNIKGMQSHIPAFNMHFAGMHVTLLAMPGPLTEISLG